MLRTMSLLKYMTVKLFSLTLLEPIDYDSLDLNKLSPEELAKHKKKMDRIYEKNFVKPGDPNFVYDKRKQFISSNNDGLEESWEEE